MSPPTPVRILVQIGDAGPVRHTTCRSDRIDATIAQAARWTPAPVLLRIVWLDSDQAFMDIDRGLAAYLLRGTRRDFYDPQVLDALDAIDVPRHPDYTDERLEADAQHALAVAVLHGTGQER